MRYQSLAIATILAIAPAAFGAAWTPSSGTTSNFTYSSGQDTNGRFGTGLATSSGFSFGPAAFTASISGSLASTADTTRVDVIAATGRTITSIRAEVSGDYTIVGSGLADTTATLTITDLDTTLVFTQPLVFPGIPAITLTSGQGVFSGTTTITLPAGVTRARLQLSDTISAIADPGSSSLIQIKDAELGIVTAIPEPTSMLALAGVSMLLRRSRR